MEYVFLGVIIAGSLVVFATALGIVVAWARRLCILRRFRRHDTGPHAGVQWSYIDAHLAGGVCISATGVPHPVLVLPGVGHLHSSGRFSLHPGVEDFRWRWTGHALQGRARFGRRITIGPLDIGSALDLNQVVAGALVNAGHRISGARDHD